jgi:hypothetical protein
MLFVMLEVIDSTVNARLDILETHTAVVALKFPRLTQAAKKTENVLVSMLVSLRTASEPA